VVELVVMSSKKVTEAELILRIEEKVKGLLTLMNRVETEVEVKMIEDQEEEKIMVRFLTDDPGPMIGFKGKHLAAIQTVLGLMVNNKKEEWTRVLVDVNDYRDEQKVRLEEKARNLAQECLETGRVIGLERMSSYERRIVHMAVADIEGVETVSEGEGEMRRLLLRPVGSLDEKKE
jgi:spoIIIJ-associated protein